METMFYDRLATALENRLLERNQDPSEALKVLCQALAIAEWQRNSVEADSALRGL